MIKPTIGRVVWFYPAGRKDQVPLAAIVTAVWGDRCVNLSIFERNGVPMSHPPTSVQLVQEGDSIPEDANGNCCTHCTWMPYQIGQAAKHEALAAAK